MARKFLYFIVFLVLIVIAGAVALNIWSREATEFAFVPRGEFVEQDALADNAYDDPQMWYSRPGIGTSDPSRYQPAIGAPATPAPSDDSPAAEQSLEREEPAEAPARSAPDFAVFFVHPTSYLPNAFGSDTQWNAALGDEDAETRARLFLSGLASPFNRADEIWAPKYRQAAVGAFLTDRAEAQQAIDAAYRDVAMAFDYFVASVDEDMPIVLAGHSQGALHILTLLRQKVAGTPLEARIAAAYPVGWPISVAHDLPALPLPACATARQDACLVSWNSFADGGDPSFVMERYRSTPGFDGQPRGDGALLCVNPLTGTLNGRAGASRNLGTLVPDETLSRGELVAGAVPARCDEQGLLRIGPGPELGSAVLPGDNYHVYDIPLFWRNLQDDVVARVQAWSQARS